MKAVIFSLTLMLIFACDSKESSQTQNTTQTEPSSGDTVQQHQETAIDLPQQLTTADTAASKTNRKEEKKPDSKKLELSKKVTDYAAMAKDMCQCYADVEKELKPTDIALLESFSKKVDKDMASDTAALRKVMKENQKEMMAIGFLMMRLQKHMKAGSPAQICLTEKSKAYNFENNQLTEKERAQIANSLETAGCKFLSTLFRMGEGFMK